MLMKTHRSLARRKTIGSLSIAEKEGDKKTGEEGGRKKKKRRAIEKASILLLSSRLNETPFPRS